MKYLFIILLNLLQYDANAQNENYKSVSIINKSNDLINSNEYQIYRLDTNDFKQLLNTDKMIIQFWQPWCEGVEGWIDRMNALKDYADSNGINFYLISDARFEESYFVNKANFVGMITKYFNEFNVRFKTYIISSGMQTNDYKDIMKRKYGKNLKYKYVQFLIEKGKIVYQNFSYYFYVHYVSKILYDN